jgi:hypothetical protein
MDVRYAVITYVVDSIDIGSGTLLIMPMHMQFAAFFAQWLYSIKNLLQGRYLLSRIK